MGRQPKEPSWPFLCILACLFVLSAAAPRAWEKTIRSRATVPAGEETLSETESSASSEAEVIAQAEVVDPPVLAGLDLADASLGVTAAASLPSIRPTVEQANGLLMVIPSPRIGARSTGPGEIDLETPSDAVEGELIELRPPYARTSDTFLAEENESFPVEEVEAYLAEVADGVAEQETASPSSDEAAEELRDDQDLSAVAGVTALSADEVSELAAARNDASDRFDAGADWMVPVSVFVELEPLSWGCETGQWARDVASAARCATADLAAGSAAASESVERLLVLCRKGIEIAKSMDEGTARYAEMGRVLKMLDRRVMVWQRIAEIPQGESSEPKPIDWKGLSQSIEQMRDRTTGVANGEAWSEFLELGALTELAAREPQELSEEDRVMVRAVIMKLRIEDLTEEQRAFFDSKEATDLEASLVQVAMEPIDARQLAAYVEAFERTGSPAAGELLAVERLKLALSTLPAHVELAQVIEEFYCGPNVRIAVTGYLLNRMLPDQEPEYQWVRDTVLGHSVRGRSRTSADVGLVLIPDTHRMRAALTVDGLVSASTSSTAGPATFFNDSESVYSAVKELELTPMGIDFQPVEVRVENKTRLRQVRTDFDGIPLIGSLVKSVAQSQHEVKRPAIRREMSYKVQSQAERQIDEEIDARFGELNDRLKQRLLDPLAAMSLRPEVAEAETTKTRMSMQLQLAGPCQLGSHTPRPWAPADSVLSFQIHQSAFNNVLNRLELDGATLTIKQLRELIGKRFNRPEMLEKTTEHDDVEITFAARDAIQVEFQDGRIAVSLGIQQLRAGARQWRDFRVRACYRTETSRQSAFMTRDGVVELIGSLRTGSQISLRGIFSKTFAKDAVWSIVPEEMTADPRLHGLEITQLCIDDGWFGLAIGPERIHPALANSPSSDQVK